MEIAAWIQAVASVAMIAVTAFLIGVTSHYVRLTHNLVKSQVDPVMDFELSRDGQEIVIQNGGAFQVLDVSVNPDTVIFAGPPLNKAVARITSGRKILGEKQHGWWHLERLDPGEIRSHSISDVIEQAMRLTAMVERPQRREEHDSSPREEKRELYPFLIFHLVYHRDFDHKRYSMRKTAQVITGAGGGSPSAVDPENWSLSYFQELVRKLHEVL